MFVYKRTRRATLANKSVNETVGWRTWILRFLRYEPNTRHERESGGRTEWIRSSRSRRRPVLPASSTIFISFIIEMNKARDNFRNCFGPHSSYVPLRQSFTTPHFKKLRKARYRLYRGRVLQENTNLSKFRDVEICTLLHWSNFGNSTTFNHPFFPIQIVDTSVEYLANFTMFGRIRRFSHGFDDDLSDFDRILRILALCYAIFTRIPKL